MHMKPRKWKLPIIITIIIWVSFNTTILSQTISEIFPEIIPSVLSPVLIDYDDGEDLMHSRLFKTTTTRQQINLAGFWDFIPDPANIGESKNYHIDFPTLETRLWVPGTWNATARYWQYQGPAWFKRELEMPVDGNLRIRFGGVFYLCSVWFNGKLIGEHEGGYSPFDFVLTDIKKGKHTLIVRVDNTLNDESLPKDGVDWFPYGGIFRPVYAEVISDIYIDRFHIIQNDFDDKNINLRVKVYLINNTRKVVNKNLVFKINGEINFSESFQINNTNHTLELNTQLKKPKLWSPEKPNLYSAQIILGENEDDQFDRFGVRKFSTEGYKILLNGNRFKLMGANHHDDHPDWGSALPPDIIRKDVEILKRMRANAVRGHYPPSEMFMDFCDQAGLVFMNEVPSWQYRPDQLAKKIVKDKIKQQYFDMVYRDMNHPAIFSWSLGNEWREFEKAYDDIKELVAYARTVDTTHFITFITGGAHIDRSTDLVDIICTNWAKFQWYWNPTLNKNEDKREKTSTILDEELGQISIRILNEIHEKFPEKPVILTEFGGSGSQAGWHNWGNVKWSEEYQARNVWDSGLYGLERDWISGGCVWQFCDTRTTPYRILGPRLRGWNVKGVVDEYRQPKMAFYKLQELFSRFNTLIFPSH